ncbi:MAG TPA: VWA domain-containing protein [Terriglobales bacterium]|nr:VWA domain-containing protein [Terriglobales bacterium]
MVRVKYGQGRVGRSAVAALAVMLVLSLALAAGAQNPPAQPPAAQQPQQQQQSPEAGGPAGDVGPIAVPKKKEEPPPPKPAPKKVEGMPDYTVRVDVPVVNVDVTVTTKDGHFIPGLGKGNFRIYEDGVPQTVTSFQQSEAPITAVLLVEFAANNYNFVYDMLNSSYIFASQLKPKDWVAVVSYDMKPSILVDFTQDKSAIYGALNSMRVPMFSETNMFDALWDTLDRMDRIEGHKYIILVSTGVDTFSKKNLDQVLKKIQATRDVTIYTISTGVLLRLIVEPQMSGETNLTFLQADNQMQTFARMTGGMSFQPRFEAELPEIFRSINGIIRNQYTLSYQSTNPKQDGSYRKIKVELVDGVNGGPIQIRDQKGKAVKYNVIARDGYRAKQAVE